MPEPLVPRAPAGASRDGLRTLAERAALERAERERAIASRMERDRQRAAFEQATRRRAEVERAEREMAARERALEARDERETAARQRAARERAELQRAELEAQRVEAQRAELEQAEVERARVAAERVEAQRAEVERAPRERADAAPRQEGEHDARERSAGANGEALALEEAGCVAEADAAKERWRREADRELEQARLDLARPLLPVLDNLDRTIDAARRDSAEGMLEGLTMVRAQFEGVLGSYGLERIVALGQPFDPAVHEAVATVAVDDPDDDGRVVDEWQRGYRAGGRVLRPAAVRVGRFARA